jgi:hypothetical protein
VPPRRPVEPSAPVGWVIAAMLVFWPTGIPALLASHRAARAYGAADLETATRESANARRWGIISVCVGGALILLSILLSVIWLVVAAVALNDHGDGRWWDQGPGWSNELPHGSMRPGLPDRPGFDR